MPIDASDYRSLTHSVRETAVSLLTSEASQQVFFPKFLQGAVAERSEATRRNKKWQTGGSADPGEVNGLLREELEG